MTGRLRGCKGWAQSLSELPCSYIPYFQFSIFLKPSILQMPLSWFPPHSIFALLPSPFLPLFPEFSSTSLLFPTPFPWPSFLSLFSPSSLGSCPISSSFSRGEFEKELSAAESRLDFCTYKHPSPVKISKDLNFDQSMYLFL